MPKPEASVVNRSEGGLELAVGDCLLRFPAVWLRDNCPCAQCLDPGSGQKLKDITDIPNGLVVSAAGAVDEDELLTLSERLFGDAATAPDTPAPEPARFGNLREWRSSLEMYGSCLEELGKAEEAYHYYQQLAGRLQDANLPDHENAEAEQLLRRLRRRRGAGEQDQRQDQSADAEHRRHHIAEQPPQGHPE